MICVLCQNDSELKRSHIIPEFLYQPLYDDKHRFHVLDKQAGSKKFEQKGIREKLLCADCETLISRYEKYFSEIFYGTQEVQFTRSGKLVTISSLNYAMFRLFGLSILWRAGVSRHPFFKEVNLGPYEEPLREMILSGNPGEPNEYGFLLGKVLSEELPMDALMLDPTISRLDGHRCYRFVFAGFIWTFFVTGHALPPVAEYQFVKKSGEMVVLEMPLESIKFLYDGLKNIANRVHEDLT